VLEVPAQLVVLAALILVIPAPHVCSLHLAFSWAIVRVQHEAALQLEAVLPVQ
jgi:hypothetical protein